MREEHDWRRELHDGWSDDEMEWYHFGYWTAKDTFWDMQHGTLEDVGLAYCYHSSERVYYEVEK